jgi:hypothetical protein
MVRTLLASLAMTVVCVSMASCSDEPDTSANPQVKTLRQPPAEKVEAPGSNVSLSGRAGEAPPQPAPGN